MSRKMKCAKQICVTTLYSLWCIIYSLSLVQAAETTQVAMKDWQKRIDGVDSLLTELIKSKIELEALKSKALSTDTTTSNLIELQKTIDKTDSTFNYLTKLKARFKAVARLDTLMHRYINNERQMNWLESNISEIDSQVAHFKKEKETLKFLKSTYSGDTTTGVQCVIERIAILDSLITESLEISARKKALFPIIFPVFVDTPTIELKEWNDYSNVEKLRLVYRWNKVNVEEIVKALEKGHDPIKTKVKIAEQCKFFYEVGFDLRGIPLMKRDLTNIDLASMYLQGGDFSETILEGADLQNAQLPGVNLSRARLKGANLRHAHLQGANLSDANLQGADLSDANLQGADLGLANLQGANLLLANLQGANLLFTKLQGTHLGFTKLQDADLFGATFDSTYLLQVNLGEAKNIRYIKWGDSIENRYIIGEEKDAYSTKSEIDFGIAEITYRDLKAFYKKELMDDVAGEFHFRENEVRTKSYAWYDPVRLSRLLFLKLTYGYGSRPSWLLWYSLVVVGLFSFIFLFLTINPITKSGIHVVQPGSANQEELLTFRKGRLIIDCFYFSLLSFATFGYGALQPRQWLQFFRLQPVEFKPVRWARICVGIEAALGIWIFALLVTVLFGRG